MLLLSSICFISLVLFLLFDTNVIADYCKFLKLNPPHFKEYLEIEKNGGSAHYLKFVRGVYHNNFFIKLISCSTCLSVWLSLILSLISFNLLNYPIINAGGLLTYFLLKLLYKFSS
jgi:hypothetical protein